MSDSFNYWTDILLTIMIMFLGILALHTASDNERAIRELKKQNNSLHKYIEQVDKFATSMAVQCAIGEN